MNQTDVIIVGGGPAGMTTAFLLARHGTAAAVLDDRHGDLLRVGEVLPPGIRPLLSDLGLWEDFVRDGHLPSAGVTLWWGGEEARHWDYIRGPYGDGWHVDRARFEEMLASSARTSGAKVARFSRVLRVKHAQGAYGWQLDVLSGGKTQTWQARFLVHAAGRSPVFRQIYGARQRFDQLIGIAHYFTHTNESPASEPRLWLETTPLGWWYTAPLPNNRMVAVFLTDMDLYRRPIEEFLTARLQEAPNTKERLNKCKPASSVRFMAANTGRLDRFAGPDFLTVGDATYSVDPASGRGIVKALRSAQAAAQVIVERLAGPSEALSKYVSDHEEQFQKYSKGLSEQYRLESRWPDSLFWCRRHSLMERPL